MGDPLDLDDYSSKLGGKSYIFLERARHVRAPTT
nr:MAG TPA: hypothetical protein [Caudoviricetes sp.]